ncbi:LapA family protein [Pseudanabaena mucicola]|uniref:LapA family protein n=1 Tax=Pseudanabaena mucicola FACHB-723 TaxID=2692860 RepID=A0ABR7ZU78_9CYAN|nr:LapA family protein [Pseudanabaena mucicola]MBD2187337.1 LapA family protein [Pseudanabaena mucicola FACHB-723]
MSRSRFDQNTNAPNAAKKSPAIVIVQLLLVGITITLLAAIVIQNLQPAVQVILFGQKMLAIPLSVAMLIAFVSGGILALVVNAIANWRQNVLIRRAVIAAKSSSSTTNSQTYSTYAEDDDEYVDEEDEYEDEDAALDDDLENLNDPLDDDEVEEEDYVDDDPDTVPYGDRPNMRSSVATSPKNDRPPLDAKFIR